MNSIKNSTKFDSLVKGLVSSLFQKKLSEITTTASIDAYQTPYAFSKKGMKKKRKKNIEKQTGYKFVDETPSGFKKYGDLSGKWIPENIYHDIVTMDKWRTGEIFSKVPMLQAYRKLNSFWKLTKTAYNAPTHTSNFGSNIAKPILALTSFALIRSFK